MVACKGVETVRQGREGWRLEDYMDDYERKMVALNKITEHHLEQARLSWERERAIILEYSGMLEDIADALWWEVGELRCALDERDSEFYVSDQKKRNDLWSTWVNKNLELNRLEKRHRELMERLYPY